jgi:pyridoxal phosphate enzyme (YggS family)
MSSEDSPPERGFGEPSAAGDAAWDRRAELQANLVDVRTRIHAAEATAGRPVDSVTLVAVTKTWPASDVALLASLGVVEVAENRHQEAVLKHELLADLDLRWHFIGQLQRNKCRAVTQYADVIESVDRPELAMALDRATAEAGRHLDVLIQVDLQEPPAPHRGGAAPAEVLALADVIAGCPSLNLTGVMAVAPLDEDARPAFDRLFALFVDLQSRHDGVTVMSAGMSQDLEQAVAAGTTHVRIGTSVLGRRPRVG